MSIDEGWKDLRTRLPSMSRAYVRQRIARLAVRVLFLVGIGIVACISLEMRGRKADLPRQAPFEHPPASRVSSTSTVTRGEAAVDATAQVEAKESQGQR
jgi:hypothetical protein